MAKGKKSKPNKIEESPPQVISSDTDIGLMSDDQDSTRGGKRGMIDAALKAAKSSKSSPKQEEFDEMQSQQEPISCETERGIYTSSNRDPTPNSPKRSNGKPPSSPTFCEDEELLIPLSSEDISSTNASIRFDLKEIAEEFYTSSKDWVFPKTYVEVDTIFNLLQLEVLRAKQGNTLAREPRYQSIAREVGTLLNRS